MPLDKSLKGRVLDTLATFEMSIDTQSPRKAANARINVYAYDIVLTRQYKLPIVQSRDRKQHFGYWLSVN